MFTESSLHLFQPPKYINNNNFFNEFNGALAETNRHLTIDIAAIQSYLSFGFVCGNRTLINEISRQPWLSTIKDGEVKLENIPQHSFYTDTNDNLAKRIFNLLLKEARESTKDFENVYVLLSGGLDSRIVAGVLKHLYDNGELRTKPVAVTWGLKDSRDVVYAKELANKLVFEWIHVPIEPETVLRNINAAVEYLGLIHSPELLHNMLWFRSLPQKSIVLAGSFGDSIGRAEFAGLHLLQLKTPYPKDNFNLLKNEFVIGAEKAVQNDIQYLFQRASDALPYAHNEHFMQGYRMRSGLCHSLSVINGNAKIYQMFSAPEVYGFIWSLHPSIRGNDIYIKLFRNHLPDLVNLPWARTNRALGAKTIGAEKGLLKNYHEYTKWSKNELRKDLEKLINIAWFENLGIFNTERLLSLRDLVRKSVVRVGRANDIWLWLAGFRIFIDNLEKNGKKIAIQNLSNDNDNLLINKNSFKEKIVKNAIFNTSPAISGFVKDLRTKYRKYKLKKIKQKYIVKYPQVRINNEIQNPN